MEVVASLSQGRTAAAQCGLFTYKSVPVILEPPCISTSGKGALHGGMLFSVHIKSSFFNMTSIAKDWQYGDFDQRNLVTRR